MRVVLLIAALSLCWLTSADAATTSSHTARAGDQTQLMRWVSGRLVPLSDFELQPLETYFINLKYFSGDKVVAESELATMGGLPAIISAGVTPHPPAQSWRGSDISNLTIIRNPGGLRPNADVGPDLGWMRNWDATCGITLNDLRFNIYYPGADTVAIDVRKSTRPAPVIDDQQGNIVFSMHYPPETAPEPYGTLTAPISEYAPQHKSYTLAVTQYRDGQRLGAWSMGGLTNYFSTGFAINAAVSPVNPIPADGPFLIGRHVVFDDLTGNVLSRAVAGGLVERSCFNVKVGFLSVYFDFPNADEATFELYEEDAAQNRGTLADSVTWRGPTYGTRLVTRRPFAK